MGNLLAPSKKDIVYREFLTLVDKATEFNEISRKNKTDHLIDEKKINKYGISLSKGINEIYQEYQEIANEVLDFPVSVYKDGQVYISMYFINKKLYNYETVALSEDNEVHKTMQLYVLTDLYTDQA